MVISGLLLLAVSVAWASDYLFIGWAVRELPPIAVAAGTTGIAALVLMLLVGPVLRRPLLATLKQRPLAPIVMAILAVALPKLSVVMAEESISPDLASLVGTTVPILTFLITVFVTRQAAYSHLRMAGVGVAFTGMLVFVGLENLGAEENQLTGMLTMMAGGAAFALNGVYASLVARDLDDYALTVWVLVFGAIGLGVATLLFEAGQLAIPSPGAFASLAGSGILSMGMAYLGYYLLIARAGAYFTSFYAYLVPPFGLLAGALFMGERITFDHLAGVAITLLGMWMLTRRADARVAERHTMSDR